MRPRWKNALLGIALISIVMLPRLLGLGTFIGPDEKLLWGWGNKFALSLYQGDLRGTLIGDGLPAVTLMWINAIGVALKWLWLQICGAGLPFPNVIGLDRPLELYAERRLFLTFFDGLQLLAAYPLLRRLWNRDVAMLAVVLMAIEPFSLGFTRMIRADALLSGFMWLSALAVMVFIKTHDRRYNWLAGALGGLAALSKFTGAITALIAISLYMVVAWHRARSQGQRINMRWLGGAVLGFAAPIALVFFGLWPAWWFQPVEMFNLMQDKVISLAVDAATQRAGTYFWGAYHPLGPGLAFYPVLAALRLTPWLVLGSLAAIGLWLWRSARLRSLTAEPIGLAVVFSVVAYWAAITVPGLKIDRYLIPVVPGLAILTALALASVVRWARVQLQQRVLALTVAGGVAIGLGVVALGHVAAYHPLYSTYYDPLASPEFVQWALPIGQGEGVDVALTHLGGLPGASGSTVVCGTNFPRCAPFFAGDLRHQEELRTSGWFEADYVLWHIDEQQVGTAPPGVLTYLRRQLPVFIARYHGIDYTWLYPVPQVAFRTGGSKLEGIATLLGYDVEDRTLSAMSPGQPLKLHVYWRNEGQAAQRHFWWRVEDDRGYIWSQAATQPLPGFEVDATQKGAVMEGEAMLSLPSDMPPGAYRLKAGFAGGTEDVGQFALPAEGSRLLVSGMSVSGSQPGIIVDHALVSGLVLRGYDVSDARGEHGPSYEPVPGEVVWVTLYWQAVGHIQHDYTFVLRLLDSRGKEAGSWSGRPVHNRFPTDQWLDDAYVRDPWRISLPADMLPGDYQLVLSLLGSANAIEMGRANLGVLQIAARRVNFEAPPMQFQANVAFGDVATLLGYNLSGELVGAGARVRVELYWRALRATARPYTIGLRLVGADGLLLAEQRSSPADGALSTTEWQADEIIADVHEMEVSAGKPASVSLEVRLLDAGGNSVPAGDGQDMLIISDVEHKIMWRVR